MTIETAVLIETLVELGASVRWASCNIFSTQDHAAAAIAKAGIPVFAWKGETLEEYWDCTLDALTHPGGKGPQLVVDDGGDATLLIHKGYELEDGDNWVNTPERQPRRAGHQKPAQARPQRNAPASGTTSSRIGKASAKKPPPASIVLYQMKEPGKLLVPAINVNDSVTKSKFDNLYGCRESLADGIKRATDVMVAGKVAVRLRLRRCRQRFGAFAARIRRARHRHRDRSHQRPAGRDGRFRSHDHRGHARHGRHLRHHAPATATSSRLSTWQKMKDQAIVCNIGHFDNEIQVDRLNNAKGVKKLNIKPQVDKYTFAGGHSIYHARRRPPGESRLRHRPSELRHVQLLLQPGARATRPLDEQGHLRSPPSIVCPRSSTRKSPACTWKKSA